MVLHNLECFINFFFLLHFSTAKEFNVLHGLHCIPCIHPSSCAQINPVNTFLFYVFFYAGILNRHDFKVFIPNKTCTNEMLYHSASCVFSLSVGGIYFKTYSGLKNRSYYWVMSLHLKLSQLYQSMKFSCTKNNRLYATYWKHLHHNFSL